MKKDLIAGVTVGIVAIPLGMAFAIASGVKPEYGLYTTIIAGILVALFGGSRYQVAGPTGAFIPILLAIVLQYGYEDLLIAGFLAGILLILMGIFKLGSLIKYIPRSVTVGFTSGIAVIIFTGQIGSFLGIEGLEKKEYFHENMLELAKNISGINGYSILSALIGLALIIIVPKFFPRVPVLLIALLIPTAVASILYPDKVATIGTVFGGISQQLPSFQFPNLTWEKLLELWRPAFVIAMLGGIESLLSAVVADGMTGDRHRSNKELVGQGIANVTVPLFGGIPATGAIARTATNIKSGAVSPFSGVFQGLFVLLTLLVLAPYASYIPLASMAPILMVVAFNMSEYKSFYQILKLKTSDSLVLGATFLLTVFVNLTVAVEIGLLLAAISFIRRMSGVLEVEKVLPNKDHSKVTPDYPENANSCPKLSIFTVEGALFFGAADKFESVIAHSINKRPAVILLRMNRVPSIDATAEANLRNLVKDFQKTNGTILIAGINEEPLRMLKKTGLYELIGKENFFPHTRLAIDHGLSLIDFSKCKLCSQQSDHQCAVFKKLEPGENITGE
nr:SulP family inorganic anion transporter [Bacillus piscicola]